MGLIGNGFRLERRRSVGDGQDRWCMVDELGMRHAAEGAAMGSSLVILLVINNAITPAIKNILLVIRGDDAIRLIGN